jgi:hypothetical protein
MTNKCTGSISFFSFIRNYMFRSNEKTETRSCEQTGEGYTTGASVGLFFNNSLSILRPIFNIEKYYNFLSIFSVNTVTCS